MAAGFNPAEFWEQSPRSFVAIMEGAARAATRKADSDTRLAYRALQFYGLAMKGRLKSVEHYLLDKPRRQRQTTDQMLTALREFAAMGTPMTIRQVN